MTKTNDLFAKSLTFLKYCTLLLVLLNIPGVVLERLSPTYSSALSYLSFILMLAYPILSKKLKMNKWMILFGTIYFGIGILTSQTFLPDDRTLIIVMVKYFIITTAGYTLVIDTTKKELLYFLILGSSTVFLQIFVYYNPLIDGGRYSGFYLNANSLGIICTLGYALSYSANKKIRLFAQILFTAVGFLTFSRTFILIWLMMNLLAIRLSLKNIKILLLGLGLFIGLLTFNEFLPRKNARLVAMTKIFDGKSKNTADLEEGGRSETWQIFYPYLYKNPFLGNGYSSFGGGGHGNGGVAGKIGVHNTYLMVLGESGFIPLLILLSLYTRMLIKGWKEFLAKPHLFLMVFSIVLFLSTNHNYLDTFYLLFCSMWLQNKLKVDLL